ESHSGGEGAIPSLYDVLRHVTRFARRTFSLGILLFAVLAFLLPGAFLWIVPHISFLLGVIMFGMGLTLSAEDFKAVFEQPRQVLAGVAAQFTVMPLLAYFLAS